MKKRKNIIKISATILVIAGIVIIINRINKKKLLAELDKKIAEVQGGKISYGTPEDLKYSNAFNVNFWKQIPTGMGYKRLTEAGAKGYAEQIHNSIGAFSSNEAAIIGVFKKFKAKSDVSQVAYWYQKVYNKDFFEHLKTIDYTLLGLGIGQNDMAEIQRIVNGLPDFRIS